LRDCGCLVILIWGTEISCQMLQNIQLLVPWSYFQIKLAFIVKSRNFSLILGKHMFCFFLRGYLETICDFLWIIFSHLKICQNFRNRY
jgi:hypothetical protein